MNKGVTSPNMSLLDPKEYVFEDPMENIVMRGTGLLPDIAASAPNAVNPMRGSVSRKELVDKFVRLNKTE